MTDFTRRRFLGSTAASFAVMAGGLGVLGASDAYASDVSGYKALVHISMFGGIDGSDVLLPTDSKSYNALAANRPVLFEAHDAGGANSARARTNLVPLNAATPDMFGSKTFGLAPEMSTIAAMFNAGDAAVIANIGPLNQPINRDDFHNRKHLLPPRLFSHNSQRSIWSTRDLEGRQAGWGGEFLQAAINADPSINPNFAGMNTANTPPFLDRGRLKAFRLPEGAYAEQRLRRTRYFLRAGGSSEVLSANMAEHLGAAGLSSDNIFQRDLNSVYERSETRAEAFNAAFARSTGLSTPFPDSHIGRQLASIARAISMRGELAGSRQIFHANIGNFDSHGNQTGYVSRLQEYNDAVSAFRDAMVELGEWSNVTVFSTSDFGRTLRTGSSGTDHGWGSHHMVMGGAVRGGRIIGAVPDYDVTGGQYVSGRGRLIPTISVDQYAATLGRWFGLDDTALRTIFPNLQNFSRTDLGLF